MGELHYCSEHQSKFYKNEKGGKTWYSHKLADGSGFHNEPVTNPNPPPKPMATVATPTPIPVVTQSTLTPAPTAPQPARVSSPETGMWYNQLGEMIRNGEIDKTTAMGKQLRAAYYSEMFRVLGIKVDSHLADEARRMGAVDII